MWREGDVAVRSMTGFGASTFEAGGAAYACTIRSVNRKHVDVAVRLPVELAALEPAIRSRVQAVCSRGDVSVVLERDRSKGARRVDVDETAARVLADAARRVAAAAGIDGNVSLSFLLSSPDVLRTTVEADASDETVRDAVMTGVEEALTSLDQMRQVEGTALEQDIAGRIDALCLAVEGIRREAAAATVVLTERAIGKMRALAHAADVVLEPQAMANAVASLAERLDVAEELSAAYEMPISCSIAMPPCLFDTAKYKRLTFGFCAAGSERAYYTLDPVGNVRPCNHSPRVLGNIREASFRSMTESAAMKSFMSARPAFCGGCKLELECQGGCKAAAEACYGDASLCDPFLAAFSGQAVKPI